MERKDAVQYENALEPSIIRCYTDGSKLIGRPGASFYIEYASGSQTDQNFFHLERYTKSRIDVCNEAKENLPLLNMPADQITKTKVFGKQYKCLVMERKDAVQYENALEPIIIRCYTDGSS